MQTEVWIAYSDSMHFSDKLSYKTLFISKYGLKDINYTRFEQFLPFSEKQRTDRNFSHRGLTQPQRLPHGTVQVDGALTGQGSRAGAGFD
jgi:hypothetical protein